MVHTAWTRCRFCGSYGRYFRFILFFPMMNATPLSVWMKSLINYLMNCLLQYPWNQEWRVDYEYERKGTCSIFVFNEPLSGWVYANARERRTAIDFAHEIKHLLTVRFPNAKKFGLHQTIWIPMYFLMCTKPFRQKKTENFYTALSFNTRPNTEVGSIWPKYLLAF